MAAPPLNVQLRNAQSSILFMQESHAQTLLGLHKEIHSLQKKYSDISFELAMKDQDQRTAFGDHQDKLLEVEMTAKTKECLELLFQLKGSEMTVNTLERQAKVRERLHQEEKKQLKLKLASLMTELEKRAKDIAYLTTQLHQIKLRQRGDNSWESIRSPVPPSGEKPPMRRRHKVRTTSIELPVESMHAISRIKNAESEGMRASITRDASSASSIYRTPQARHMEQDLKTILPNQSALVGRKIQVRATPAILPPISSSEDRSVPKLCSVFPNRSKKRSSMETLAVNKVCTGDGDIWPLEQGKGD